ncbi:ABC-three component system protein [Terrilactibacillus laevilacticus]|uniref:ABC-three component system protein n=1 Tax=Terrilactibacillus laevilacticus TaxID=1380157 RepID=A0ABW5PTX2_9BACI|nr:ABC-three component system protein [Terrilactibacillus laevilacticus]
MEEYLKLLEIKKTCLRQTALHDATFTLGLEYEIENVVEKIYGLKESDILGINYNAVAIAEKFVSDEFLLKSKITGYVMTYFTYIRDLFKNMETTTTFNFDIFSGQIRACFIKMDSSGADKTEIFESMVDWINIKTQNVSRLACEAIIAFFVQHCEVFYEITK